MTKADEDAIREIELQFNEAWGRHNAEDMVASLSDDAQFVTVNGAWTKSRADYLDLMTRLHGPNGPFRASIAQKLTWLARALMTASGRAYATCGRSPFPVTNKSERAPAWPAHVHVAILSSCYGQGWRRPS
jgi:hypothetical protein